MTAQTPRMTGFAEGGVVKVKIYLAHDTVMIAPMKNIKQIEKLTRGKQVS